MRARLQSVAISERGDNTLLISPLLSRIIQFTSWTLIVGLPILLLLTALTMGWDFLTVTGGYGFFMFVLRLFSTQLFSKNLARLFKNKNKNKNV